MKYKIEKDLKIIEEDTNYGVSLIGLLEGREMQETIEMRDKEDFGEQIKNFKTIAQDFQWREDISFGVVEDKKVAFALKNKYPTWFKVGSMNHDTANTILVTRKKARY